MWKWKINIRSNESRFPLDMCPLFVMFAQIRVTGTRRKFWRSKWDRDGVFFSLSPVFSVGCNQFIFEVSLSEALPPLSSFCVLASVRQWCRPRVSVPETQLFLGGRPMQGTWGAGSVDRTFWLWGSSHVFSLFLLVVKQKCLPPNWSETWVVEWGLA